MIDINKDLVGKFPTNSVVQNGVQQPQQMTQAGMLGQGLAAKGIQQQNSGNQQDALPLAASLPSSDMSFNGMTKGLAGMNMLNMQNSKNAPIIGGANLI